MALVMVYSAAKAKRAAKRAATPGPGMLDPEHADEGAN